MCMCSSILSRPFSRVCSHVRIREDRRRASSCDVAIASNDKQGTDEERSKEGKKRERERESEREGTLRPIRGKRTERRTGHGHSARI
jgi:hypothetical protein